MQRAQCLSIQGMKIYAGVTAYAGCNNAQFAGTWDVVFNDGYKDQIAASTDVEQPVAKGAFTMIRAE